MSREGSVRLIEVDHYNQDSEDYSKTDVIKSQIELPERDSFSFAAAKLMEEIIGSKESIVVDLGGNSTANEMLTEIGRKGISTFVDMVIVPVSASGRDVINARATINHIREVFSDFEGKIVIVHTRAITSDIERLRFESPDIFDLAQGADIKGPVIVPNKGCFASSRYLLRTAWEISEQAPSLMGQIKAGQVKAKKERDIDEGRQLVRMRDIVEESASLTPYFEKVFEELDILHQLDVASIAKEPVKTKKNAVVDEAADERP